MNRTTNKLSLAVALAVAGSACAPMEQAPLVYTSRAQIGVGVTAGTPENPGLDVNIGYKALDAAFVPVAVAKICGQGQTCKEIDPNLQLVNGRNEVAGTNTVDQRAIDALERQIAQNVETGKETGKQLAEVKKKLVEIEALGSKRLEVKALDDKEAGSAQAAATLLTPEEETKRAQLKAEIDRLNALGSKGELDGQRAKLEAAVAENAAETVRLKDDRDRLISRKQSESGDRKFDAYSVYGTFNGSATGHKDGASLTAGKVFSTGVAAQNLSQGVSNSAKTSAATACLIAARELLESQTLTADEKKVQADRLTLICGVKVEPAGS